MSDVKVIACTKPDLHWFMESLIWQQATITVKPLV